ncbi:MAG: STAS domain-containing protein [Prolixibacteraceae bacterium]|nr:STAS domain-containing protein [Prolixibacteraceae bacterium]
MNNLEIRQETRTDEILLFCSGRLDANSAGHLNDFIDRLIQEGHYNISLDMSAIEYLSSAGIRSLVTQYRNLNSINGYFIVSAMSKNVKQVLDMVGMSAMLSKAKRHDTNPIENKLIRELHFNGLKFNVKTVDENNNCIAELYGNPELIKTSEYTESEMRVVHSENKHFSFGLGAIGDSFSECNNHFGEYMMLGRDVIYLPSDGSKKPDYMTSKGQLIATISELYGLHFDGNFSHVIRFDPENSKSAFGISLIIDGLSEILNINQFAFVMIAESAGLIGISLNSSPVNREKIFTYPEIKETINFTTEPAHVKMLTISTGIVSKNNNELVKKFLRPLKSGSDTYSHIHSAVFQYIPMKKSEIDLYETTNYLIENIELKDVLHLANDDREIVGLGESQFSQGTLWIVPLKSIELTDKTQ